jgi:hypothetical protein
MFPLISVGLIETVSASDAYEPDVQAVIDAIQATGVGLSTDLKQACNDRIAAFKARGIWEKLIYYYGFLGGTAAAHAINWRSPGVYNVTWNGGVSHSSLGAQGSSAGYGDTGYNPYQGPLTTSMHLASYCRTESAAEIIDMGLDNSNVGGTYRQLKILNRWTDGICYFDPVSRITTSNSSSLGLMCGSIDDGEGFIARNGTVLTSATVAAQSIKIPDFDKTFWIMGANANPGIQYLSNRSYGSFSLGDAFTQAEAIGNYLDEQVYQTALGRQV